MLPVDAQISARLPSSRAFATARTIPRSLNEPDGLQPSNFPYNFMPSLSLIRGKYINGVEPSSRFTFGVFSVNGSKSPYFFKTPMIITFPFAKNFRKNYIKLTRITSITARLISTMAACRIISDSQLSRDSAKFQRSSSRQVPKYPRTYPEL